MRRITLLTLGLLALILAGSGSWAASIRIEPTAASVGVGDSFAVSVFADGVVFPEEVLSFGFDVDFDPLAFDLTVAVWPGQTLTDPATPFGTGFFDESDLIPGTDVAGSWFDTPGTGLSGDDILLATLGFTAKLPGSFSITLSSTDPVYEGLFTSAPAAPPTLPDLFSLPQTPAPTPISGTVSVTVSAVPEPGTLLLLGTGLTGVAGVGRRRRTPRAG